VRRLNRARAGEQAPTTASLSASETTSDRAWADSAGLRASVTRVPLRRPSRAPKGDGLKGGNRTTDFHRDGWATQKTSCTKGAQGPREATEEDRCVAVRCAEAPSLPITGCPTTAHAPPRTRDNEPAQRIPARWVRGHAGPSSRPHRWTRTNSLRGTTKDRMGRAARHSAEQRGKNQKGQRRAREVPAPFQGMPRPAGPMRRANAKPAHRPSGPVHAEQRRRVPPESPTKTSPESPTIGGKSHHGRKNSPAVAGENAGTVGLPEARGGQPRGGPWQPASQARRLST